MLRNYLVVAVRNFIKKKTLSIINIIGLSIGITCCLLVFLFIRHELSYDRFHKDADRIFATSQEFGKSGFMSGSPGRAGELIKSNYPEVESFLRVHKTRTIVKYSDKIFQEEVSLSDPQFFQFFTFPLKTGNPETVLQRPEGIVLTKEMVDKYFGDEEPVGKTMSLKFDTTFIDYTVTGIAENFPDNSSIQLSLFVNFHGYEKLYKKVNSFEDYDITTFLKLTSWDKQDELEEKLPALFKTISDKNPNFKKPNYTLKLYSLVDYHFYNWWYMGNVLTKDSDVMNLYILSAIAFVILLIACFNFINLSLGSSSTRLREVGTRKLLGGHRNQIAKQFWFEGIINALIAVLMSIVLTEIVLPVFNSFEGTSLSLNLFNEWSILLFLIVVIFIIGTIVGSYPGVVLSKPTTINILRGKFAIGTHGSIIKSIITLQFALSIFIIFSMLIMRQQYHYLTTKDPGYEYKNVIIVPLHYQREIPLQNVSVVNSLKNELRRNEGIESICGSTCFFTGNYSMTSFSLENGKYFELIIYYVDYDFIETFGINILEGRSFLQEYPSDLQNAVLVNETFIRETGVRNPVGESLSDIVGKQILKSPTIIGVMKDFHIHPLYSKHKPLAIKLVSNTPIQYVSIKLKDAYSGDIINRIREDFTKIAPDMPFEYYFLEDRLVKQYEGESRWLQIITLSSILAIFIACLGLFGMSLLAVNRRTKEIGIRKVLGASVWGIVIMLSKEFLKWVLIANVIAWPIAYYAMNKWLQNFAYRIDLGWWIFVLAGMLALVIALLTVSYQAVKAARANPVDSLRYE